MTRVAVALATAGGAGYAPLAPGTVGSAVGVALYLLVSSWPPATEIALAALVTAVGTWAAAIAARHFERSDPSQVVIDEVAGQLVALSATGVGFGGAILGFVVFRVFDVLKPWPCGRLETLGGGVGIVADDVMAGLYANFVLQVGVRLLPGFF